MNGPPGSKRLLLRPKFPDLQLPNRALTSLDFSRQHVACLFLIKSESGRDSHSHEHQKHYNDGTENLAWTAMLSPFFIHLFLLYHPPVPFCYVRSSRKLLSPAWLFLPLLMFNFPHYQCSMHPPVLPEALICETAIASAVLPRWPSWKRPSGWGVRFTSVC